MSKSLHPDTTSLPLDEAASKFQEVCEAYDLLSDPERRKAYDQYMNLSDSIPNYSDYRSQAVQSNSVVKKTAKEVRRPFSGGELFSLLLLGLVLLLSLLIGITVAFVNGRDLQVNPSWLIIPSRQSLIVINHF